MYTFFHLPPGTQTKIQVNYCITPSICGTHQPETYPICTCSWCKLKRTTRVNSQSPTIQDLTDPAINSIGPHKQIRTRTRSENWEEKLKSAKDATVEEHGQITKLTLPSYSRRDSTSGAIYAGVPTVDFGLECRSDDYYKKVERKKKTIKQLIRCMHNLIRITYLNNYTRLWGYS